MGIDDKHRILSKYRFEDNKATEDFMEYYLEIQNKRAVKK
jgi:hypothetical protein